MRKFTKEIASLLATAAVGLTMGAAPAPSEELQPTAGVALNPDAITETTETPLAGGMIAEPLTTEAATNTGLIGTTIAEPVTTTKTTTTTGLIGTTIAEPITTTTTLPPLMGDVAIPDGDSNCDGQLDMSDAVLVMQALANPNKYGEEGTAQNHLTPMGRMNADMNGDGLTVSDAQAIQKKLLNLDEE